MWTKQSKNTHGDPFDDNARHTQFFFILRLHVNICKQNSWFNGFHRFAQQRHHSFIFTRNSRLQYTHDAL